MKKIFATHFPNISQWTNLGGRIELGYDADSPLNSFIRIIDSGGMPWEGQKTYKSIDLALQDAENAISLLLKKFGE